MRFFYYFLSLAVAHLRYLYYNTNTKVVNKLTIGQRIKNRRLELSLSVEEVASKLGKNRATVYRYEKDDIKDLPITVLEPLAKVLETTPADLMGWEEIDSSFSGKEAPSDIYAKFAQNIERHHGKASELLKTYNQLSSENKDKTILYSKQLLSLQKMDEELIVDAAHARTDLPSTPNGQIHDDSIMDNDSEWE